MTFGLRGMKYISNRKEYLEFIDYIRRQYYNEDTQAVDDLFGLELESDEDTGVYTKSVLEHDGNIDLCPHEFPVIVYYYFDESADRVGKVTFEHIFWMTPEQLGIKVEKTEPSVVKKCRWKLPMYEQWASHKCRACNGLCADCERYWLKGDLPSF